MFKELWTGKAWKRLFLSNVVLYTFAKASGIHQLYALFACSNYNKRHGEPQWRRCIVRAGSCRPYEWIGFRRQFYSVRSLLLSTDTWISIWALAFET